MYYTCHLGSIDADFIKNLFKFYKFLVRSPDQGRRMKVLWGKSHEAKQFITEDETGSKLEPVPGLPSGK